MFCLDLLDTFHITNYIFEYWSNAEWHHKYIHMHDSKWNPATCIGVENEKGKWTSTRKVSWGGTCIRGYNIIAITIILLLQLLQMRQERRSEGRLARGVSDRWDLWLWNDVNCAEIWWCFRHTCRNIYRLQSSALRQTTLSLNLQFLLGNSI